MESAGGRHFCRGERDTDFEARRMRVLCADRASVNPDDAIGDRKTQAGASGFTIARLGYAIKRLEDSFEIVVGNALSVIANHEQNIRFVIGLK